uniref:Glycine cleavage system H protein (GcvH, GCSH) n=1 Tax=uncultured marine group II/III euryarchaeote KM3_07_G11 TaxID=1457840 RepID=A0A075G536_9EURY|nr:glycine cleavage system H protein (gcvH, GCSH) [uncultured marine group II/III euryarchaeote KM3_07_G11]
MVGNMSEVPADLYYTADHEWLRITDGVAVIGITDHAQDALTDIVYVELPDEGASFGAGEEFASVESVKSVSGIFCSSRGRSNWCQRGVGRRPRTDQRGPVR